MTDRQPGRPATSEQQSDDARSRLIATARRCFLSQSYDKVTTRHIAQQAGVNKALINYYFGGKQGLFKATITAVSTPVLNEFRQLRQQGEFSIEQIMRRFTRIMTQYPDFPALIFGVMQGGNAELRDELIDEVIRRAALELTAGIKALQQQGQLDPALDPQLLTITLQSLMISPLLLRPVLELAHNTTLDQNRMLQLAEQNIRLFSRLLQPVSGSAPAPKTASDTAPEQR